MSGETQSRHCLPDRRHTTRIHLRIGGQALYLDVGEYPNGTVGEIWVVLNKVGATLRDVINAWAVEFSNALQQGATLENRVRSSLGMRFEPSGEVSGHEVIRYAGSLQDLVARVLAVDWLGWTTPDGREEPRPPTIFPAPARIPEPAPETVVDVPNPSKSIDSRIKGSGV